MIRKNNGQQGFTLTELMFAMAFVAFVLIFIVTAIVQTMRIYNKGLAIREINQSGRQLTEDISRTLRYANADQFSLSGYRPAEQRLCANGVSYVWNIEGMGGLNQKNHFSGADRSIPIKLVRVNDRGGQLCANPTSDVPRSQSRDLIGPQLAVSQFLVERQAPGIGEPHRLVTIDAVISTSGANLPDGPGEPTLSGFECTPGSEGAFCAFGNFKTTVYIRN